MKMLMMAAAAALLLSGCAGTYVAVDGGAHTGDIRIGSSGSR